MKRFFLTGLFLGIALLSFNSVYAANKSGTLKLQLTIKNIFNLSLDSKSSSTIDFGLIAPGMGNWGDNPSKEGLGIICQTNSGEDWNMNIQATSDFISDDLISTMPCSLLQWMCVYAEVNGSKLDYPFSQFNPISIQDSEIYSSLKSSYSSKNGSYNFKVKFMFGPVPPKTKPGNYTTNIVFTMTQ